MGLGLAWFFVILVLPAPGGMAPEAKRVAAVAGLMALWWMTEAIPIPATALLPIILFPVLQVMPSRQVTLEYGNHLVFLFIGGFFLAVTMERWNLHRRIALRTILLIGSTPRRMVLGFMVAAGFLSMWVSNTATSMMMVPIGIAVIQSLRESLREASPEPGNKNDTLGHFSVALMLGIAYASSIGGVSTIIGTPTNTVVVGTLERLYGRSISFVQWMSFAVPLSAVMLVVVWWILTHRLHPLGNHSMAGQESHLRDALRNLGPLNRAEKYILAVWSVVVTAWILRGLVSVPALRMVHDTTIAIAGALALFLIPVNARQGVFLLDWETAVKIPWGVVLLFGGGFALAGGLRESGLDSWLGGHLALFHGVPVIWMMLAVVVLTIFLTEITSNTATTAMLAPIMAGVAENMHIHPFGVMIAAGIAASYAFMLPVATPPNAVVFGSGYLTIPQMARAGIWMNLAGCILIVTILYFLMPLLLGIDLSASPAWITP